MPQHELEARIDAVDAQLVRDTCYKYIYDRYISSSEISATTHRRHLLVRDICYIHLIQVHWFMRDTWNKYIHTHSGKSSLKRILLGSSPLIWGQNLLKLFQPCLALNWPKLAWCKVRWNVYSIYAVQLICMNVLLFFNWIMFIYNFCSFTLVVCGRKNILPNLTNSQEP